MSANNEIVASISAARAKSSFKRKRRQTIGIGYEELEKDEVEK